MALLPDGTKVRFGRSGYSDYTIHKDPVRMQRYLARHSARENWRDPKTAGFWSRWLLWSEPSLRAAATRTGKVIRQRVLLRI